MFFLKIVDIKCFTTKENINTQLLRCNCHAMVEAFTQIQNSYTKGYRYTDRTNSLSLGGIMNYQSIIRSNLQYAALSALRRLPLDPGNPAFLHRAVQGLVFFHLDSSETSSI